MKLRTRYWRYLALLIVLSLFVCSLAPVKKIAMGQLTGNADLGAYRIDADMEYLLETLNRRGEAVVQATHLGEPVYLQIFYGTYGIMVRSFDREEYGLYE